MLSPDSQVWQSMQREMGRFVLGATPSPLLLAALAGEGSASPSPYRSTLTLYRNNTMISLREALAAAFPVVARLVGEDCFFSLARAFIRAHPPRHAAMIFYGRRMPDFITCWEPVASLPYLADVARLELAWAQVYHAAETTSLDPASLAALSPSRLEAARLHLVPALQLLASPYPIAAIWRAHQGEGGEIGTIDLSDSKGEWLILSRPGQEVLLEAMGAGDWAFLQAIAQRQPLGEAWDQACAVDASFDLAAHLRQSLLAGRFCGVTLP